MSGKIAVVGAGPSGCYLAQALLKAQPDLELDVIDALPVPYGLVRYGVAADHQGTKAVARQFARVFERQGARFFGNVAVGRDIALDELRDAYDVVVLAAGLAGDRRLGIPGDDLPCIHGAGTLTRALYEHPDAEALPAIGSRPLIVGNGNVAIDLLRLLAKAPDELDGTDLGPGPSDWLARSGIGEITIVGRSPAAQAKFDPVMIKELHKLGGVTIRVVGAGETDDPEGRKRLDALAAIDGHQSGPLLITFRFGLTPVAVEGSDGGAMVRFASSAGEETVECSSVLTAIGFRAAGDLPRDEMIAAAGEGGTGRLAPGLYAAGWFNRGPRGTIPENRADAQALADLILADLSARPAKPGRAVLERHAGVVDYEGWQRIDAAEIAAAAQGRCRAKISDRSELLRLAGDKEAGK
ncbi:MAG: FAD-dependent oxidoreductase [Rhizobiaceae bacterium]